MSKQEPYEKPRFKRIDLKELLSSSRPQPHPGLALRGGPLPELAEGVPARQVPLPEPRYDMEEGDLPPQADRISFRAGRSTEMKEYPRVRRPDEEIRRPADRGRPYPATHPGQPILRVGRLIEEEGE